MVLLLLVYSSCESQQWLGEHLWLDVRGHTKPITVDAPADVPGLDQ